MATAGLRIGVVVAIVACWLGAKRVSAGEVAPLPEGPGLSAKYPGDCGIDRDPAVLFADDFEAGDLEAISEHWGQMSNKGGRVVRLVEDDPLGRAGRAIEMTSTLGENTGGHLYTRLKRPVEKVFARFYVKFPPETGYVHHFVHLGGYNPPTPWPQGGAGERPRGDDRITVGIEPHGNHGRFPPPGVWSFYCYWHEMKISADGRYWGNAIQPATPAVVPTGRWQCVEVMLKLNSKPELADGELALWLDGKPIMHVYKGVKRTRWTGMGFQLADDGEPFEGFRWRSSEDLKINFFWLLDYVTENAARQNRDPGPPRSQSVRFDNVVVAEKYIGPLVGR
ncbi:hypothetical protein JCM19992_26530 [Thermostilla marina]